jgi:hypothetical protein
MARRGRAGALAIAIAGGLAAGIVARSALAGEDAERRFSWKPSVDVKSVFDDNVFNASSGKQSDFGFWVLPRLELEYAAPAYEVGADLGVDLRRYVEQTSLDRTFGRVDAWGEVGLLPGLTARVENAFVPQPTRLGAPPDDPFNLQQTNRTDVSLRYWRELESGREISLGASGSRFMSDSFTTLVTGPGGVPTLDTDFQADFWEGGGFVEFQNPLGGTHAVYATGLARHRSYGDTPTSDHTEVSGLLGIRAFWIKRLQLDLAGGVGLLAFDGGSKEPRFLARADATYRFKSGVRLVLGLDNNFASDLLGNEFLATTGRFGLERYFGRRTNASVVGFVSHLDQASLGSLTNLFGGVEVVVRRRLSRGLQLALSYRYWQNGGDYALDDFRQNRAWVGLSYDY